jgi:hypothetical protein
MNDYYVYVLVDPINRIPFYIGKGRSDRCYRHLKGQAEYNDDKLKTISNIRMLGFEPVVYKIYEGLDNKSSLRIESLLIDYYDELLTNIKSYPPDRTGCSLTEEHKQKLREKNVGKTLSQSHKDKIGNSNKHIPTYDTTETYVDKSLNRNEGSKNPRAKRIECGGIEFGCMKDAMKYYGVSKPTFKKRYTYKIL